MREVAAIIELAEERDRKECISLDRKVDGANRELAQWLLVHPTYTAVDVARWLNCDANRIKRLRVWARNGFDPRGPQAGSAPHEHARSGAIDDPLKTNDNFQDDDLEPSSEMEAPAQILTNILDSIKHAKSVAEAYRKILKSSPFDREAKAQIYNAIGQLIVKWRHVQSTLDKKGQGNGSNENN